MIRRRSLLILLTIVALAIGSCAQAPTGPNDNSWHLLPGHVEELHVPAFRNGRDCWIYLPPGYAQSRMRYPVLYVNDGWVAFDVPAGIHINRIVEDMIRSREIPPIIVVAISPVSADQRYVDYIPPHPWFPEARGDLYLSAVCDTLKPEVDRRFRTLPDPANTAMTGFSLGGLISVFAGFSRYDVFGKVAGFSPTYAYGDTLYELIERYGCEARLLRLYQDTGFWDDNNIWRMEEQILKSCYYPGLNFMSLTVTDGEHSVRAWENRFDGMLRFLYTYNPYVDPPPSNLSADARDPAEHDR